MREVEKRSCSKLAGRIWDTSQARTTAMKLIRPMEWLGRSEDWEIGAMERGAVGVRLLYKLGDIPDLSEKYQAED
jgi:hypothetical protein